jgi:hypothetical protein
VGPDATGAGAGVSPGVSDGADGESDGCGPEDWLPDGEAAGLEGAGVDGGDAEVWLAVGWPAGKPDSRGAPARITATTTAAIATTATTAAAASLRRLRGSAGGSVGGSAGGSPTMFDTLQPWQGQRRC